MSGSLHAWYSQRELESLADREGVLSGELQLSRLTRLVGMLHSDAGSVRASLKFGQRRDGWLEVDLTYTVAVELTGMLIFQVKSLFSRVHSLAKNAPHGL